MKKNLKNKKSLNIAMLGHKRIPSREGGMKGFSIIVLCTIVIYILIVMLSGKNIISKIVTGLIVFLGDTYILMLLAKVISLFGKYYFNSWVIGIFFALEFRL